MSEKTDRAALLRADEARSADAASQPLPNVEHAPGPWVIYPHRDKGESYSIEMEDGGAVIATVMGWEDFPCVGDDDLERVDAECGANAHLIAAAPELYEALKASIDVIQLMQEWARRVSDQYLDGDPQYRFDYAADMQSANEAVRLYQAFLAKAEGRQIGSGKEASLEPAQAAGRSARAEEGDH